MTDTGARCDRCGRRLPAGLPDAVNALATQTLCLACAHPAYRRSSDSS